MAFLDETGLATFLSYVKAWGRATFASKTDTQTIEGATEFTLPITGSVTGSSGSCTGNAATASAVAWSGVTGKPSTFTPSSHAHGNLTNDGKVGSAAGKPLVTGTDGAVQAGAMITEAQIDALFS